jgi:hypothetical protein
VKNHFCFQKYFGTPFCLHIEAKVHQIFAYLSYFGAHGDDNFGTHGDNNFGTHGDNNFGTHGEHYYGICGDHYFCLHDEAKIPEIFAYLNYFGVHGNFRRFPAKTAALENELLNYYIVRSAVDSG